MVKDVDKIYRIYDGKKECADEIIFDIYEIILEKLDGESLTKKP